MADIPAVVPHRPEPVAGNYFIAAYPPFSCWTPGAVTELDEALRQPPAAAPLGLYVHLPFCPVKCDYCYYLSYTRQPAAVVDRYLDALVDELSLYAGRPAVGGRPISFIYFGGGTPSTLSTAQASRLVCGLQRVLPWIGIQEVTYESAPRSVRYSFLETLRELGVTRLSMGVQSFDNTLLTLNGRVHLAEDVYRAWPRIRQAGFDWVNLDLMVGLIGETAERWRHSVREVIKLSPDSVTIYQTEIPYNTRLYQEWKTDSLPADPVPWDVKRARLDHAFNELERAGYTIVSGYAAVKDPVRHEHLYQKYLWGGYDMIGLGVASFSYFDGMHFQNEVTLEKYQTQVGRGRLPLKRAMRLSDWDKVVREFILQLKFGRVATARFQDKFGIDLTKVFRLPLEELADQGWLTVEADEIRLTREGLLRVDRLLPWFYDSEFQDVRYT